MVDEGRKKIEKINLTIENEKIKLMKNDGEKSKKVL
jgi:hypothetical protein